MATLFKPNYCPLPVLLCAWILAGSCEIADAQPKELEPCPTPVRTPARVNRSTPARNNHKTKSDRPVKNTKMGPKTVAADRLSTTNAYTNYELTADGNSLYFTYGRPGEPVWLWRTDGSSTPTLACAAFVDSVSTCPTLYPSDSRLYFSGRLPEQGRKAMFVSRVTPSEMAPEVIEDDHRLIETNSSPRMFTRVGNLLYYVQEETFRGEELWVWKPDQPENTATRIRNFRPLLASYNIHSLVAGQESVAYFVANDTIHGEEIWKTDGTDAGTTIVKDIARGWRSSNPKHLQYLNGSLWFTAADPQKGRELFRSDGNASGTEVAHDIVPHAAGSSPQGLSTDGDTLFFSALSREPVSPRGYPNHLMRRVWRFAPTSDTSPTSFTGATIEPFLDSTEMVSAGENTYFPGAEDFSTHTRLMVAKDISCEVVPNHDEATTLTRPRQIRNVGGTIYFVATHEDGRSSPAVALCTVRTDDGRTSSIRTFYPEARSGLKPEPGYRVQNLCSFNSKLYFILEGPGTTELWVSDGIIARPLFDLKRLPAKEHVPVSSSTASVPLENPVVRKVERATEAGS